MDREKRLIGIDAEFFFRTTEPLSPEETQELIGMRNSEREVSYHRKLAVESKRFKGVDKTIPGRQKHSDRRGSIIRTTLEYEGRLEEF